MYLDLKRVFRVVREVVGEIYLGVWDVSKGFVLDFIICSLVNLILIRRFRDMGEVENGDGFFV